MSFERKVVLITGGSSGLGLALAHRFFSEGADVAICGASEATVAAAEGSLREAPGSGGQRLLARVADIASPAAVDAFVAEAAAPRGRVDVAICNAGIQGPIGPAEEVPWEEWVRTVEVNLFGVVLTCRAVVPLMRRQGAGKIVALSGGGATAPRPRFSAYASAKAGVARFVETLAAELAGSGIDVNAVAPGSLNTRMLDELLAAGPGRTGPEVHAGALRQRESGGTPFEKATDLIAFLASPASDGITGRLLAAVWDDWRALPAQRESLAPTDIYTLRRIVPEDRPDVPLPPKWERLGGGSPP